MCFYSCLLIAKLARDQGHSSDCEFTTTKKKDLPWGKKKKKEEEKKKALSVQCETTMKVNSHNGLIPVYFII